MKSTDLRNETYLLALSISHQHDALIDMPPTLKVWA